MTEKTIIGIQGQVLIPDPPIAFALFQTTRIAWLWLILCLYLGYSWPTSGGGKLPIPPGRLADPYAAFGKMQLRSRRAAVHPSHLTGMAVSSSLCSIISSTNGSLT